MPAPSRRVVAVIICAAGLCLAAIPAAAAPERDGQPRTEQAKNAELDLIKRPAKRFERSIETHLERVAEREETRRQKAQAETPDADELGVPRSTLEAIAACESGGDPRAVNTAGYYGKYQFDPGTWQSVGGNGNPAEAPEAEQDYRAALLYSRAGSSPWPVCGA